MPGDWLPPAHEVEVGLGFYASHSPGFPARIKAVAEDFRVQEVAHHPTPAADGAFTILTVVSRNWEQHELSRRLARELRLPPHALRWAGTKDRRALAERLASYHGSPPDGAIAIPGVEVTSAYRAREGITLGHHFGNRFELRLSVPHGDAERDRGRVQQAVAELTAAGGVPNLFGPQRFGEVRPVTHIVGRLLVRGDVAGAVEAYLTALTGPPDDLGQSARRAYGEHHDAARALREFPPQFTFERLLLDHLARGHPPERALRALGRELRLLFVHAFQSLLFNRWVSERWARGLSLLEPVAGDVVVRVGRDGGVVGREAVPVTDGNLTEVADTVRRGGARLAGPLVGYDTPQLGGAPGEILERLLDAEGVRREAFTLPLTPEIASAGTWRPVSTPVPTLPVREECDPTRPAEEEHGLWLTFTLPKGSYATVLLRELTKPGAVPRAAP